MAFYLSPLVDVNEIDLTTTIPAVATSIGVIVLRNTYKGPQNKKTLITSTNELINTFGKPTNVAACYKDILSATGFLKYGNMLYCTRVMPADAKFAGTSAPAVSGSAGWEDCNPVWSLSDFASGDPDDFAEETPQGDFADFIAASVGAWGNNIRIALVNKTWYDYINTHTWAQAQTVGFTDETMFNDVKSIDSALSDAYDFLVVVSAKAQGSTSWNVVEYFNVSTDQNKVDDQGKKKFAEMNINGPSNYIRICLHEDAKDQPVLTTTTAYVELGGGEDGTFGSGEEDTAVIAGYNLYANPEDIDINIVIDSDKSMTVKSALIELCETRKDAMAVLDCISTDVINNADPTEALRVWRRETFNENTSYASFYGNWLEVYDKWNGKYRWVPASGFVAGIYANTDDVSDPWWAPAGLNRALLTNIRRLAWNPTLGQRNILYKNGINPIVSFAGQGKVVWGQKTLLDKESAFNRVNVRRLFIVLEKAISTAAKYFLFEPNDDLTRLLLVNMIDPFLRDVRSRRGIYDFMIVCDETNNTPERIDRNELWCDIYIKPTRAAEFIVLNFIATKTGASFTEIAGATAA